MRVGYLALLACVVAEQVGLPIPATPALLAAGAFAASGHLSVALVMLIALAGSSLADYLWYRAGVSRREAVRGFLDRHPNSRLLQTARRLFERYGSRSLVFAKFVPVLSLAAPPLSGICGVRLREFLIFNTVGSLVWVGTFVGAGYFFGAM
jgi:membrane protein DedA with SNARE-associated domain